MTPSKILIVGNPNHQLIINKIEWLRKEIKGVKIDVLSDRAIKSDNRKYFDNVYVVNFYSFIYSLIQRVAFLRKLYVLLKYSGFTIQAQNYDIVHIHFLNMHSAHFAKNLKKVNPDSKIIISIWGSDFYHHFYKDESLFKSACSTADFITFANEYTLKDFASKITKIKAKLTTCRFGLAPLDQLTKVDISKAEAKTLLGFDSNSTLVTIGYNLSPYQQHLKICDEIEKLKLYRDSIHLILPITYGGNKRYKTKLINRLSELSFDYTVYDQFLDDKTISLIRKASDLLIQTQQTDQFSGSMQEYLFTRNIVITGSWLPYGKMKEIGIEFEEISDFSELSGLLNKVLKNFPYYYNKTEDNPSLILSLSKWENTIKQWSRLYSSAI